MKHIKVQYKDHVKHIKVFEEMDHMVDNLMEVHPASICTSISCSSVA